VWGWGGNDLGPTPTQVSGLTNIVDVAAGNAHSLALTRDGRVWAWGINSDGQLGDGTTVNRWTPVEVIGLQGVSAIAAGNHMSLAVQRDGGAGGLVWAWGQNRYGQLGDGSTRSRSIPIRVLGVTTAVHVAANSATSYAVLADGTMRAWGRNQFGQLADGNSADSLAPVVVSGVGAGVSVAGDSTYALLVERRGLAWGLGKPYNCVYVDASPYYAKVDRVPYFVPRLTAVNAAAVSSGASIFLRWDGEVSTAGQGYLGVGSYETYCGRRTLSAVATADNAWLLTDADGDGLAAWREYEFGTDPLNADSDGDGLSDGIEAETAAEVTTPDDDGDGVPNALEIEAGTDPFTADTDGDGYADGVDAFPLDAQRHDPLAPTPGDTTAPTITLTEPTNAVPRP
jgi:hypothetical protein